MTPVVLHVGPGKCGSTSIQHELRTRNSGIAVAYDFWQVDAQLVLALKARQPDPGALREVRDRFARQAETGVPIVLSHEMLFKHPLAVRAIAQAASERFSRIVLIGYSRRQSSFVGSSYSEWLFQLADRQKENWDLMVGAGLHPNVFSGVERHYIAAILSDFRSARQKGGQLFLNWCHSYEALEAALHDLPVRFSVGQIPTEGADFALIEDFYCRAGVEVEKTHGLKPQARVNPAFHPDVVEAVGLAALAGQRFPEPKERTQVFRTATQKLGPAVKTKSPFLDAIRAYVDGEFLIDNRAFCRKYGLDMAGFEPAFAVSRSELDKCIAQEQQRRMDDPQILDAARQKVILTLTRLSFL